MEGWTLIGKGGGVRVGGNAGQDALGDGGVTAVVSVAAKQTGSGGDRVGELGNPGRLNLTLSLTLTLSLLMLNLTLVLVGRHQIEHRRPGSGLGGVIGLHLLLGHCRFSCDLTGIISCDIVSVGFGNLLEQMDRSIIAGVRVRSVRVGFRSGRRRQAGIVDICMTVVFSFGFGSAGSSCTFGGGGRVKYSGSFAFDTKLSLGVGLSVGVLEGIDDGVGKFPRRRSRGGRHVHVHGKHELVGVHLEVFITGTIICAAFGAILVRFPKAA